MQNLLIFEVGPYRCAVDKGLVTGIESVGTHRCQGSEKSFRYVVHVDGAEQVICNLPMVFDLDDAAAENESRTIIKLKGNGRPVGFVTDQVFGNVSLEDGVYRPLPPVFNGLLRKCFPRIFAHDEKPVLVADPTALAQLAESRQASAPKSTSSPSTAPEPTAVGAAPVTEGNFHDLRRCLLLLNRVASVLQQDRQRRPEAEDIECAGRVHGNAAATTAEPRTLHTERLLDSFQGWEKLEDTLNRLANLKVRELLFRSVSKVEQQARRCSTGAQQGMTVGRK